MRFELKLAASVIESLGAAVRAYREAVIALSESTTREAHWRRVLNDQKTNMNSLEAGLAPARRRLQKVDLTRMQTVLASSRQLIQSTQSGLDEIVDENRLRRADLDDQVRALEGSLQRMCEIVSVDADPALITRLNEVRGLWEAAQAEADIRGATS